MFLVTAAQMRALDQAAIAAGVPSLELMERAGEGLARVAAVRCRAPGPVGVLLGRGNNAGDGLVAARRLCAQGYQVHLFVLEAPARFTPDTLANFKRLAPLALPTHDLATAAGRGALAGCRLLIDALLGTGLSGRVRAPYRVAIAAANVSTVPIVAADIPSGLCADTGRVLGAAIHAAATATFGCPKLGLVLPPATEYVGRVEIIDIGIPQAVVAAMPVVVRVNEPEDFVPHLPVRHAESHKGDCGHVLVIAGSPSMPGAGLLASRAVLRVGAGMVTYALPQAAYIKFDPATPEIMMHAVPDVRGVLGPLSFPALRAAHVQRDVVALGPGIGRAAATQALVAKVVAACDRPLVCDADALFGLRAHLARVRRRTAPTVLTPHPGEMARLCGKTARAVQADRVGVARAFAMKHGVWLVLKGHRTVIAAPDGQITINMTGNAGMATAGAGDVLTGVLAGLLAQRMPVACAVPAGVYLHGLAGDLARSHKGDGLMASDIVDCVPEALRLVRASGRRVS